MTTSWYLGLRRWLLAFWLQVVYGVRVDEPWCDANWRSHGCFRRPNHRGRCRCDCGEPVRKGDRIWRSA